MISGIVERGRDINDFSLNESKNAKDYLIELLSDTGFSFKEEKKYLFNKYVKKDKFEKYAPKQIDHDKNEKSDFDKC